MSNGLVPPEETNWDQIRELVLAAIGDVPYVGSTASSIMGMMVTSPISNRTNEFHESIIDELQKLQSEKENIIENLVNNEIFTDAVLSSAKIAISTRHQEKRNSLRNSVLNVAEDPNKYSAVQDYFFQIIEQLTIDQIQLLHYLKSTHNFSISVEEINLNHFMKHLNSLISKEIESYAASKTLTHLGWDQLVRFGLINKIATPNANYLKNKWTTEFGDNFLEFINRKNN